MTPRNITFLLK